MKHLKQVLFLYLTLWSTLTLAAPTVYPTGTTIFDPDKAWNGFTVLSILNTPSAVVIDMNGNIVKQWDGFNVSSGGPARVMPGGGVIAPSGNNPGHQESQILKLLDFEGQELWSFQNNELIETPEGDTVYSTRQHHDWQREDFPAGYYSPNATPELIGSNTLILTHTSLIQTDVADVMLEDDRLIEVSAEGEIVWEWLASNHIDEFRFDAEERAAIKSGGGGGLRPYDWMHINSATYVGPNAWFDAGDQRFAPNNVIISSRQSSVISIIGRDGSVVWQIGPDFSRTEEERAIGQVIGQHHAHLIPEGLPGAGNMIIFDNGGASGYGASSPLALNGVGIYARATSRILEINPVTLELVWSYRSANFFSTNISSAQRLPNGNTLITEGAPGRLFEVTSAGEIVWEYMNAPSAFGSRTNSVYRAYRLPYSWLPQLNVPDEEVVMTPALGDFHLP